MRFLFDTNILIERGRSKPDAKVQAWADSLMPWQVVLCPIVAAEFMIGVWRLTPGQRAGPARFLRDSIRAFCWLDTDVSAAFHYGKDRAALRTIKPRINDLWIASIAKAHGLIVATRNEKDFKPFGVTTFNPF